jgi:hypothetical protein
MQTDREPRGQRNTTCGIVILLKGARSVYVKKLSKKKAGRKTGPPVRQLQLGKSYGTFGVVLVPVH